jgi:MarR family transcriptional regulator, organic hydroperoxide resistance regulator
MPSPTAAQRGAEPDQAARATVKEPSLRERQRLDNQLCFAVYAAAHAFGRAYRNLLGRYELTYPQYLVLLVLWEQDEILGIGRRARDRVDERQVSIFLTPDGEALRDRLACIPDDAGGLTGLDLEGRKTLLDNLVNLRTELQSGQMPE